MDRLILAANKTCIKQANHAKPTEKCLQSRKSAAMNQIQRTENR